jgi:hypothetical protein
MKNPFMTNSTLEICSRRNTPTRKQWKRKTLLLEMGKAVSFSGYDIQIQ